MRVFSKVVSVKSYYEQLFKQVYGEGFEEAEELLNLRQLLNLEDFFKNGFSERWLKILSEIFKSPRSHLELLSEQEPGLSCYMQALAKKCHFNTQKILSALFNQHEKKVNEDYNVSKLLPAKKARLLESAECRGPKPSLSEFFALRVEQACRQGKSAIALEIWMQEDSIATFPVRISVDVFVALFIRHGQTFINWLKSVRLETEVLLVYGNKADQVFSFRDPYLLHHVLSLNNPWLIKGLLAFGFRVDAEGPPHSGYTPLQYAARHNFSSAIFPLIEGGADTSLLHTQRSALALALEKHFEERGSKAGQYDATIKALLAGGVPYQAKDLSLGVSCASFYQKADPLVSEALLLENPDIAWKFTLKQVTQPEEPKDYPVQLLGLKETPYLKPEVYEKIFGPEGFPKDNFYGRHNVTSISIPFTPYYSSGIHFKENPEFAAREMMVHELGQGLFGPITPPVSLFKFTKENIFLRINWGKVGYPVLATATIPGKTLHDVLGEPEELAKIEPSSFAQVLLLMMLINPEDGRADNYMLQAIYQKTGYQYKLVPIDNDRAFVRPLELDSDGNPVPGSKGLKVKTIVYCLDQMFEPLSPKVIDAFLKLDAFIVLERWLKFLNLKQEDIDTLFSKEKEALKKAKIDLQMVFKPSVIAEIYEKFKRMQYVLRENPYLSGMALLCKVIPALGYRYQDMFKVFKTPGERFEALTKGCFEVVPVEKTITLSYGRRVQVKAISSTKSSVEDVLRSTGSELERKSKIEKLFAKEEPSNLKVALEKLEEIHQAASQLEEIQQELYQGNFERFLKVPEHQQAIINGQGLLKPFDFSLMKKPDGETDIERQDRLLAQLEGLSFTALRIVNCEILNNSRLKKLLQRSKGTLSALELNNCEGLTPSVLLTLSLDFPRLKNLGLIKLPFSGEIAFEDNPFHSLRVLRIESCLGITECHLKTPLLERFSLVHSNLSRFTTQSSKLRSIELRGCKAFPEEALCELGTDFANIRKLRFKDSSLVLNALYYKRYPQFLNFSIKEADKDILNLWFSFLDKDLQARFLKIDRLNELEAFTQIVHSNLKGNLKNILTMQAAVNRHLSSKDKAKRFFAAQILATQGFQPLIHLPLELLKSVLYILLEMVKDKDSDVRKAAVSAFGEMAKAWGSLNYAHREILWKQLLEAVKDGDSDVRKATVSALGEVFKAWGSLSDADRGILWKQLLEAVKDKDSDVRKAAVSALGEMFKVWSSLSDADREALLKRLLEAVKDKYSNIRPATVSALGEMAKAWGLLNDADREALWKQLLKVVKDKDIDVRLAVVSALGELAKVQGSLNDADRKALWKQLLEAAKDKDWRVSSAVVSALGEMAKAWGSLNDVDREALLKRLLEAVKDKYSNIRPAAVSALGEMAKAWGLLNDADREALWKQLLKVVKDKDIDVGETAISALGKIAKTWGLLNDADREALWKRLLEAVKDGDSDVRRAAVSAFGEMAKAWGLLNGAGKETLWKQLLEVVKDGDSDVRKTTVSALERDG